MSSLPRISVITPSFNQSQYLEATLRSVLDQGYPNLEYIVIDGGSTDGSREILERFDDRLAFWVSERDSGQTDALNKGLARSTGDWIAYLNSDDLYLPGSLHAVANAIQQAPQCRWITGGCLFFGDGTQCFRQSAPPSDPIMWLVGNRIYQPSTFWHRSLTTKAGPFNSSLHYCMDYDYWMRLIFAGIHCEAVDYPLSAFRLHPESKTVSKAPLFCAEERLIQGKYIGMLDPRQKKRYGRLIRRNVGYSRLDKAREFMALGSFREAWKTLLFASIEQPSITLTRSWIGTLRVCLGLQSRHIRVA